MKNLMIAAKWMPGLMLWSCLLPAVAAPVGCSQLNPMSPTATTGFLFQYGSPSLIQVPVLADQSAAQTQTTHFGTVKSVGSGSTVVPAAPPAPMLKAAPIQPSGNVTPCVQE